MTDFSLTTIMVPIDEWIDMQQKLNDLTIDRDLWKETADDWRVDAIRYHNALWEAAKGFRLLGSDSHPGNEYRNAWMDYANECWEECVEALEGEDETSLPNL